MERSRADLMPLAQKPGSWQRDVAKALLGESLERLNLRVEAARSAASGDVAGSANDADPDDRAQRRDVLHRLVGGTVFA